MDFEVRPVTPEEFPAFARAGESAFGEQPSDEDIERSRGNFEFERSLGVLDNGRFVATAGIYSFDLTLPGLTTLPVAGVSWVGVMPTHRRRGILTALMRRQLDDIAQRGEALAILLASESNIYGRYGYGVATLAATYEIESRRGAFARPFSAPGRLSLLEKEEAARVLPGVYDRFRRGQPGAVTRSEAWWQHYFVDPERWRDGASARFYLIYEAETGQVDGYMNYRIKGNWEGGFPNNTLIALDTALVTPDAYTALWQYCLGVDLVGTVKAYDRPLDEPLRWRLAEPRRLRLTQYYDFVWVRLLDVPAALTGRRYATNDELVIGLTDALRPQNSGTYALEGGPEGAVCRATSSSPDLSMEIADLGAAYLGGVRFSTLARAGRVSEERPGALARADRMFSSEPAPWCTTDF